MDLFPGARPDEGAHCLLRLLQELHLEHGDRDIVLLADTALVFYYQWRMTDDPAAPAPPPATRALASLYLAAKATDTHYRVFTSDELSKTDVARSAAPAPVTRADILRGEMQLMHALHFDFEVDHPYAYLDTMGATNATISYAKALLRDCYRHSFAFLLFDAPTLGAAALHVVGMFSAAPAPAVPLPEHVQPAADYLQSVVLAKVTS
jgi:hypothetical protein